MDDNCVFTKASNTAQRPIGRRTERTDNAASTTFLGGIPFIAESSIRTKSAEPLIGIRVITTILGCWSWSETFID